MSVQVIAAKAANKEHRAWRWLRGRLGGQLYRPGCPTTRDSVSFARVCKGACRGPGGTPHAKYFLFSNVGPTHARKRDLPDLLEPDLHGLPGTVEPGPGDVLARPSTTTS